MCPWTRVGGERGCKVNELYRQTERKRGGGATGGQGGGGGGCSSPGVKYSDKHRETGRGTAHLAAEESSAEALLNRHRGTRP